jgi:sugar lactone lactonase YvrE
MIPNLTPHRWHARFKLVHATAAAWLLLVALIASSQADILYVSNSGNNTIQKFTSAGVGSVFANTGLASPSGLAFDVAGNLYVANAGANTIVRFTNGVGAIFANGVGSTLLTPRGLAFDSTGLLLYAANQGGASIYKFDSAGNPTLFTSGISGNLSSPRSLAFDSAGNVFAASFGNDTIQKFSSKGVRTVFGVPTAPFGLAVDSAGNLYVSAFFANAIYKYTKDGFSSSFASSGLSNPGGLAFDSAGNLYAANQGNNTIEKFSPTGIDLGPFASAGLNMPQFLAFTTDDDRPLLLTPVLSTKISGTNVVVSWTVGGTLLSSTNITGTYNPVVGSPTSPFTNSPTGESQFFRVRFP